MSCGAVASTNLASSPARTVYVGCVACGRSPPPSHHDDNPIASPSTSRTIGASAVLLSSVQAQGSMKTRPIVQGETESMVPPSSFVIAQPSTDDQPGGTSKETRAVAPGLVTAFSSA